MSHDDLIIQLSIKSEPTQQFVYKDQDASSLIAITEQKKHAPHTFNEFIRPKIFTFKMIDIFYNYKMF